MPKNSSGGRRPREAYFRMMNPVLYEDEDVRSLSSAPPCAQTLYTYLLGSNLMTPIPGVVHAGPGTIADALDVFAEGQGWSSEVVTSLLDEMQAKGFAEYDRRTRIVWLPKLLRDPVSRPPSELNVMGWQRTWNSLADCPLKRRIWAALRDWMRELGPKFLEALISKCPEPGSNGSVIPKALPHAPPPTPIARPIDTPSERGSSTGISEGVEDEGIARPIGRGSGTPMPTREIEMEMEIETTAAAAAASARESVPLEVAEPEPEPEAAAAAGSPSAPPDPEVPEPTPERPATLAEAVAAWNEFCVPAGLLPTGKDKSRIARVEAIGMTVAEWRELCRIVSRSPFLLGQGPSGHKATFDWLIDDKKDPARIARVREGQLTEVFERKDPRPAASPPPLAAVASAAAYQPARPVHLVGAPVPLSKVALSPDVAAIVAKLKGESR